MNLRVCVATAILGTIALCGACASDSMTPAAQGVKGASHDGATKGDASAAAANAAAGQDAGAGADDAGMQAAPAVKVAPGLHVEADHAVIGTAQFTLKANQERFLCYAVTLDQDLVIDGYAHAAQPFVHHVIVSRTLAPEPDGLSECNILFRMTWEPLFLTGAGASKFDFPAGVGHKLKKGTQVVVQVHLLNLSDKTVTDNAAITMHRSADPNPRPMGSYAFGTFKIDLPPSQPSQVQSVCTVPEAIALVAAFPHMHLLGTGLKFEVGPSQDKLKTAFERVPYDFDNQRLDAIELNLKAGDVTRLTCTYDNTRDTAITFGESTNNEMCFFVGFAVDRDGINGCITGSPPPSGNAMTKP